MRLITEEVIEGVNTLTFSVPEGTTSIKVYRFFAEKWNLIEEVTISGTDYVYEVELSTLDVKMMLHKWEVVGVITPPFIYMVDDGTVEVVRCNIVKDVLEVYPVISPNTFALEVEMRDELLKPETVAVDKPIHPTMNNGSVYDRGFSDGFIFGQNLVATQ